MQDRLQQLERLVVSMMPDLASKPKPGPSADPRSVSAADAALSVSQADERSDCGSMRVSASELRYVGGDHWAAILDSIADLKDHVDREEDRRLADSPDPSPHDDGDPRAGPQSPHSLLLY